jgi:hypothetical protein
VHATYPFAGREEPCLAIDAGRHLRVLIVPPLFDEMNRVRHTLVETMRLLDRLGVDSMLLDLPGTNESLAPVEEQSLSHWASAVGAAASHFNCTALASIRGGTLIDHGAGDSVRRWRLSPAKGSSLLRTLIRTRIAADKEAGVQTSMENISSAGRATGVTLAGNFLSPALFAELESAVPHPAETVREVQPAREQTEGRIVGSPLWLRAEPGHDPAMAEAMARDIHEWISA